MLGFKVILTLLFLMTLVIPAVAEEVDDLILDLLDPYETNKNQVVDSLAEKGKQAVDPLIDVLNDEELPFRNIAAIALGKIGDPRAVDSLIKALKDENEFVREEAAFALGKIGDPKAVDPLIGAFPKEEDPFFNKSLVVALGEIGDPRAVDSLIKALKDGNEFVREEAALALGKIGDKKAVDPLIEALKEGNVPGDAAIALGEIGDPRAVDPLIEALKDEDEFVRIQATYALGEIGDQRAVEPLIGALKDKEDYVQKGAAIALGELGDPRAIDPLTQALKDDLGEVREAAARSLEKLGRPTDNFQTKPFKFNNWGLYLEVELNGVSYFAAYVEDLIEFDDESFLEPFLFKHSNEESLAENRYLSKVLIDDVGSTTIAPPKPLKLNEGYELRLVSFDGVKANLELRKGDQIVDSKILPIGRVDADIVDQTYYYRINLGDISDIIIIAVHLQDTGENNVLVDGIFQISDTPQEMADLGIYVG